MYKYILDDQLSPDIMTLQTNSLTAPTNAKPYKMKPVLNDDDAAVTNANNTVDDIFVTIVDIYTPELQHIIYNTLILMRDNDSNYQAYAEGLNKILEPTCIQLKKWIDEHIVY
jgi:hypothetical protein